MPELPEVERAVRRLRLVAMSRRIVAARIHHAALARRVPRRRLDLLRGRTVESIERRGKHQLLRLSGGITLHVHFRMSGDWAISRAADPLPPYARASLELDDGTSLHLSDPRALATIRVLRGGEEPLPALGPEPLEPAFGAPQLATAFARRSAAVKVALLDQGVVAGVGNIYAAEALWLARISPRAAASTLSRRRIARLADAIVSVLNRAIDSPEYSDGGFDVYGREGEPCPRCLAPIRRIPQGGRSTYFCPRCQRR